MHIGLAGPEEQTVWDDFVIKHSGSEFLQSWGWGEFQRSYGRRVWRFIVKKDEEIYAVGMAICAELRRGRRYVYIPRGPIIKQNLPRDTKRVIWSLFTQQWRLVGLESNSLFVRVEPVIVDPFGREEHVNRIRDFLLDRHWIPVRHVQPQYTSIISLKESEDAILARMHSKTRYNIRLAQKKGLRFRLVTTEKEFKLFWDLHARAAEKDEFATYSYEYYRKLFNILLDEDEKPDARRSASRVFVVETPEGVAVSAALIITYGKRVVYLFGGSDHRYRQLMGPYLLHWSIIKRGKKNGFTEYDLWGVTPPGEKYEHAWQGFTRFKNGFGGEMFSYAGAFDFPYRRNLYKLYRAARNIKHLVGL